MFWNGFLSSRVFCVILSFWDMVDFVFNSEAFSQLRICKPSPPPHKWSDSYETFDTFEKNKKIWNFLRVEKKIEQKKMSIFFFRFFFNRGWATPLWDGRLISQKCTILTFQNFEEIDQVSFNFIQTDKKLIIF